jgi:hypothetical protein
MYNSVCGFINLKLAIMKILEEMCMVIHGLGDLRLDSGEHTISHTIIMPQINPRAQSDTFLIHLQILAVTVELSRESQQCIEPCVALCEIMTVASVSGTTEKFHHGKTIIPL